jgi:hypothetical protein
MERINVAEQLRVDVRVLLARIGIGSVYVLCDAVVNDTALGSVLGPLRDRVAQVLAEDTLEGLHLARLVQPAEQMVEGAILKHQHDHVVEAMLTVRCSPPAPLSRGPELKPHGRTLLGTRHV